MCSAQNTHPAAWTWNGSTLTPLAALPLGGLSVSLTSTLSESLTLATWNGKAFTLQKAAVPTGLGLGVLEDVSCSSPRSCAAVGISVSANASASATGTFGFAELWNGRAWSGSKWTGRKGASSRGDG